MPMIFGAGQAHITALMGGRSRRQKPYIMPVMGGFLSSENILMTLLNMLPSGEEGTRIWVRRGPSLLLRRIKRGPGLKPGPLFLLRWWLPICRR